MIVCDQVQVPFGPARQFPLSWRFEAGQRWAIIGRNGSGKSQLLSCLAGLQKPLAGSIQWQTSMADQARLVHQIENWSQVVSFQPAVFNETFNETLAERIEVMTRHFPTLQSPNGAANLTVDLLTMFDLTELLNRSVASLSSGEQQRTWLVQRLLQPAPILLLDEPLAHQDLAYQQRFGQWLESDGFQANSRLVMICLHQLDWAARFCTHVLAIDVKGQLIAGKVDEMLSPSMLESIFQMRFKSDSNYPVIPHWI